MWFFFSFFFFCGCSDQNLAELFSLSASKVFQVQSWILLTDSTRRFCPLLPVPQPPEPLKTTWLWPRSWLSLTSVQTSGGQMSSCSGMLCTNPQKRLSIQVGWLGLELVGISLCLKVLNGISTKLMPDVNGSVWKTKNRNFERNCI